MRNINPSNILITAAFDKLMFADLSNGVMEGEVAERPKNAIMPYSPHLLRHFKAVGNSSHLLDRWAIAIVVLEVLASSWLVLRIDGISKLREVLEKLERYMDTRTFVLLKYLLLCDGEDTTDSYLYNTLAEDKDFIGREIESISNAMSSDLDLLCWKLVAMQDF